MVWISAGRHPVMAIKKKAVRMAGIVDWMPSINWGRQFEGSSGSNLRFVFRGSRVGGVVFGR